MPCSRNSSTHSAYSQSRDFRSRLSRATSDRSARRAWRARTTVSRKECPQPRWISRVRSRFSGDLSLRSPFNAPVSAARSCQLSGKNDSSKSQSSFESAFVAVPFMPTLYKIAVRQAS